MRQFTHDTTALRPADAIPTIEHINTLGNGGNKLFNMIDLD